MKTKNKFPDWKKRTIAFLISQCITLFGSSIVQMAMIWFVTLETSSGIWVTVLSLCSFIPQMVISLFAGVWSDRYPRKMLIIAADSVIAVATLGLAFFIMSGNTGMDALPAIIAASILRSLGTGVQTPAVNAAIPQLVPEEKLMRVNGVNGSMSALVQFAAPAVAGGFLAVGSLDKILLIDVCTAVVGVAVLSFIKIPKPAAKIAGDNQRTPFFSEMMKGVQYCFDNQLVGRVLFTYGAFIFLCVPSGFLTALLIERVFGGNVIYLSVSEMVGCAGMVLGGLLLGVWGGFKNRSKTLTAGMLAYGLFSVLLGMVTEFWIFTIVLFFVSFFIPVVQSASMTMLQEKTAPDMQGRVFSLLNIMFSGFMPLGMAIFGPLADLVPIGWMMVGTGVALALLACLYHSLSIRNRRFPDYDLD